MSDLHPHGELHNPDTAHEASDISMRAIVMFVVLLAGVTVAIQVAMYGLFFVLARSEAATDQTQSPLATPADQAPANPRLQTTPWSDLKALRAEEFSYLHSYGWIDQQAGVARVPIDKAKALLLQRGLPVRPGPVDPLEGTGIASAGESTGGRNLPAGGPDKSAPARGARGTQGATPEPPKKPGGGQ